MNLKDCHNFNDFRKLAQKNLPSPIFHYIGGAADDEIPYSRHTSAFAGIDLVHNFLRGPLNAPASPPGNDGDGLLLAQEVGASLGNMTSAWWSPVLSVPNDNWDEGNQKS